MTFDQQMSIADAQRTEAAANTTTPITNTHSYSNAAPQLGTKAFCESLSAQVAHYDTMVVRHTVLPTGW